MALGCEWEFAIANLVNLSATATIAGVGIDYAVVKDYCEKYELDVIDSFSLVKRIRNEMQS